MPKQSCVICAWRENCNKRFCVPDGGSHCPDFSRDITIKIVEEEIPATPERKDTKQK